MMPALESFWQRGLNSAEKGTALVTAQVASQSRSYFAQGVKFKF
jgi:hypothetical protein